MNTPKYIIVHHTGGTDKNPLADTSSHTAVQVDFYHKSKGWDGIGYNWFIEKDGKVVKGRDEAKTGAHTIGYNEKSIGICLAGNFDSTLPTLSQIESLTKLLREKMAQYSIPVDNIVPHRTFANKTCYGKKLPDGWAKSLVLVPEKPVLDKEAIYKMLDNLREAIKAI
jgi:N-acetylmuramoyl-L-alanine amidase